MGNRARLCLFVAAVAFSVAACSKDIQKLKRQYVASGDKLAAAYAQMLGGITKIHDSLVAGDGAGPVTRQFRIVTPLARTSMDPAMSSPSITAAKMTRATAMLGSGRSVSDRGKPWFFAPGAHPCGALDRLVG